MVSSGQPGFVIAMAGASGAGMAPLVDFVVGLDTPLDIALARKLLRDMEYHRQGIHSGNLADYMEGILVDYQGPLRELYLVAQRVALYYSDLVVDGTKPVEVLAREIVDKIRFIPPPVSLSPLNVV